MNDKNSRQWLWLHEVAHAVVGEYLGYHVNEIKIYKSKRQYSGHCRFSDIYKTVNPVVYVAPYFTLMPHNWDTLYDFQEYENTIRIPENKIIVEFYSGLLKILSNKTYFDTIYRFMKRYWKESKIYNPMKYSIFHDAVAVLHDKCDIESVNY